MLKKRIVTFLLSLLFAIVLTTGALASFNVFAEESYTGYFIGSSVPNGKDIKELTNTYDLNGNLINDAVVSSSAPQLTILTHGYGSDASVWSNPIEFFDSTRKQNRYQTVNFTYDPESLIEQLRQREGDADVYLATFRNRTNFYLYKCEPKVDAFNALKSKSVENVTDSDLQAVKYVQNGSTTIEALTDGSKHIIVVFEAYDSTQGNVYVYEQLDLMIDKLVYNIKNLSGGILPRLNLIGHSRGGITNMQYTLEHPELVASVFSMGSPYQGSKLGQSELILNLIDMSNDASSSYWTQGVADILNADKYNSYKDEWNNNYQKYQHIDFYPIAGYSSLNFVNKIINEDEYNMPSWVGPVVTAFNVIDIEKLIVLIVKGAGLVDDIFGLGDSEYVEILRILDDIVVKGDWDILTGEWTIYDDLFINVESQLAYGYNGDNIHREWRKFTVFDGDLNKVAQKNTPITHNLETRDKKIIKFILSNIEMGENNVTYVTIPKSDGTISIEGVYGALSTNYVVPSSIDGKVVTEIGEFAFSENFYGRNILSVTIPSSIKKIGVGAFYNCTALEEVFFSSESQLLKIEDEAFLGCSGLSSINNIGSTQLETIGYGAFLGCVKLNQFGQILGCLDLSNGSITAIEDFSFCGTAFTTVELGQNISSIGEGAFNCGSQLTQINVNSQNLTFASQDGVLMNKTNTEILQYPQGKTNTSYVVPTTVTEISAMAFRNSINLTQITLNNVVSIRDYAFLGCVNLNTITTSNLDYIGKNVLDDTTWLGNQTNEQVILGNVLVKYQGTASSLSITNVKSIASYAFIDNQNISSITLNNGLANIGEAAFFNCSNLENVYICNNNSLVFVSDIAFNSNSDNRKIYVPNTLLQQYTANEIWQRYAEDIQVHQTTINYVTNGGSSCESNTVGYQGYLSLPTTTKTGYLFVGWYDNDSFTGQAMNEQTLWNRLDSNVTFYAKWNVRTYLANLQTKGGEVSPSSIYFTINDSITLPIPTRTGYTFEGWYINENYTGSAVTGIPIGTYGDRHYYAKWNPNEYVITLNLGYAGAQDRIEHIEYGSRDTITVPIRTGYNFVGWAYDGELITNENGLLNEEWTITAQVELVAQWSPKTTELTFNTAGGNSIDNVIISYDSMITLSVPSRNYYTFTGWYDGANGTGTQYAGANGVMIRSWDKEALTATLHAEWILTQYSITYNLDGGTNSSDNPSQYTVEDSTINLSNATKTGYRFMGWRNANGIMISTIPTGSYGNITLTAEWSYEYTIKVTANNIICNYSTYNGTVSTVKAISGEVITLLNTNFGGVILKSGSTYYEQGSTFTVSGDKSFELVEKNRSQLYDSSTGYYEIWTYSQLNTIVRNYRGSNYRLMANITQPENTTWNPMGTFSGVFEGNDHWINDLTIKYGLDGSSQTVSSKRFGLFEYNNGTIRNLGISHGSFAFYSYTATYTSGNLYCGLIAAINNGTISHCESLGSFFQFAYVSTSCESYSGAICGQNNGRVEYCEVFETGVELTTGFGGGVVGYNNGGTITHCEIALSSVYCYQNFRGDTENGYSTGHYAAVGGIVGYTNGGTISYCSVASNVDIRYGGSSTQSRTLAPELGIIAGRSGNSASIYGNTANGTISQGNGLNVVTWTEGWWIFGKTYTWNQAQYLGGTVGRYV